MSAVATAIVGSAVIGGGISYFSSQQSSEAAANAANQQAGQAQQNAAANQRGISAANQYAKASPQELNALGQSYQAASGQLAQQQQLMDSIDPSLMAASKQALTLLQGGTAAVNNPLMAQRNAQRASLVNSLQSQYGPGAESTSIGQKALNSFDMQTNTMFQQNQQTSLAQLFGIAGSGGAAGQGVQNAISGLQQVGAGYGNIQTREANAALGGVSAMQGGQNALLNSAGAGSVGSALQGQAGASLGNNFMNAGTTLGAAYLRNPSNPGGSASSYANPAAGFQGSQEGVGFTQPVLGAQSANVGDRGLAQSFSTPQNQAYQYAGSTYP